MAKIGIYSDVHISRNSSIMPMYLNDNQQYTTRLKMCYDSMTWAYKQFKDNNVDMIFNCGDTFNSHTVSSDELSTITDIMKEINVPITFPNYTIIGNHDKFNNNFNSLSWMKLLEDTTLINDYFHLTSDDIDIYCISFYDTLEFIEKIKEMLETYPRECSKAILFMHGDINGSWLGGTKRIENHIPTDFLTQYFDLVFNGHIHCHERIYNQNNKQIYNIGSLTTHSFADSNKHYGGCYILDTDTFEITFLKNPHQILFRMYEVKNNDDEIALYNNLNKDCDLKIILKIKCNYERKESIDKILNNFENIIKSKYIFTYENNYKFIDKSKSNNTSMFNDIIDEFINFLNDREDLKGNITEYIDIIK